MSRDDAELLVDLIDEQRGRDTIFNDQRLIWLSEHIRQEFGMVTYEEEMRRKAEPPDMGIW